MEIKTGMVVLPVERDGEAAGSIRFNPSDTRFSKRYFELLSTFDEMQKEFLERAEEIDRDKSLGPCGVPNSEIRGAALLCDICDRMRGEIDKLFGVGTSDTVFGEACDLSVFPQFFESISKYMQTARAEKLSKYAVKRS